MTEFLESGMTFRLDDANCFRVEQHELVKKSWRTSSQNNKACEFVTVINSRHVFVEAKSSAPKGSAGKVADLTLNGEKIPDNWTAYDNFTTYLRDISKKFIDSYNILKAISSGRHGRKSIEALRLPEVAVDNDHLEFVLIINLPDNAGNTHRDSLANLRDALTNEMRPFLEIWKISTDAVKVCWPEQARRRYGFPAV